ncbi:hypothetical protein HJFPF1_01156 [Paramyrothecium foliicola]|nr:hypothetical protein HJFPF1_01156 [Paramyrothecium foliicola]
MKRTRKGRARPLIEPIRTNHSNFNDLSQRLIPVRGESPLPNNASTGLHEPHSAPVDNSARGSRPVTSPPPLTASVFTRPGIAPDAFVIPVDLPRRLQPRVSSSSRQPAMLPPLPDKGPLTVRVVVHSHDRHFGLTRKFDVDTLRATIPEGLSPRTPTLDQSFSLAVLEGRSSLSRLDSPVEAVNHQSLYNVNPDLGSSPLSEREARLGYRAIPVDIHFARAHLPALASIMLSDQVKSGSTIELPMPHPSAWKNTILYVYTQREDLATQQVKRNILYLGGKV